MINKKNKVAIYLRVACEDKNKIEEQKGRLKAWSKSKGYEIFQIYSDNGFSGNNFNRFAYQQMMLDLNNRKFNTIIVMGISAITRNTFDLKQFMNELNKNNCSLECINESVDISKATEQLFINMFLAFSKAEMDSEPINNG